jgi:PAS domain S-box-containing protein
MELLKNYALKKKPRYVILTFYPESDTDEHLRNLVKGQPDRLVAKYTVGYGRFFRRYAVAFQQTSEMVINGGWTALQLGFRRMIGTMTIHPDIAVLRLPRGVTKKILFIDHHTARSTEDLIRSPEWRAMEKILADFKQLCEQHQIIPLILYIPAASEVYAEYSTLDSGANWLSVRESQIASSGNYEQAARTLARKIGIELISLLPAYKDAARQGKLVYYQLDVHWNKEGRDIAAQVTADALKGLRSKLPQTPNGRNPIRPKSAVPPRPVTQQAAIDNQHAKRSDDGSVMRRALNGTIESWNHGAEELYGWSKAEAVGKISHTLLKTKFPEPLAKINAELDQKGQWQGKLVHITRDGRSVVVESRWILEQGENPGAVMEINRRAAELSHLSPDKRFHSQVTVSR